MGKHLGLQEGKENKLKFKDFVFLKEEEHKKLVEEYGDTLINEKIFDLNNGIGSKGYKYKSHYHTILSWIRKDIKEGKLRLERKGKTPESKPKPVTPEEAKKNTEMAKQAADFVKKIAGGMKSL